MKNNRNESNVFVNKTSTHDNLLQKSNTVNVRVPKAFERVENTDSELFSVKRKSDESKFSWVSVKFDIPYIEEKNMEELSEMFAAYFKIYPSENSKELDDVTIFKIKSVIKNKGFFLSSFMISENEESGKPQSVQSRNLVTMITFDKAQKIASTFEENSNVKSFVAEDFEQALLWKNCYCDEEENLDNEENHLAKMVDRWKKQCVLTDIRSQIACWASDFIEEDSQDEAQALKNNKNQILLGGMRVALYLD